MSRRVRNLSAARNEFAAAVAWYEQQRSGLGADFFESVTEATALIRAQPHIGPFDEETRTRRVPVRRFPYQVVYVVSEDEIVIVAVAHTKRRPGYWRNRM